MPYRLAPPDIRPRCCVFNLEYRLLKVKYNVTHHAGMRLGGGGGAIEPVLGLGSAGKGAGLGLRL